MNKTIDYFYEITKIPRESGNENKIAEYLCEFAKKRNLPYIRDEWNNVIIKKAAEKEPIILQAHMDMVCEKQEGSKFNFEKDEIKVYNDKGVLRAKGTTLGADNGIGIAQILNVLDNVDGNIEAVFTAAEETTMIGAEHINMENLTAKKMINLDGFEENTIIKESVSFFDILYNLNYEFEEVSGNAFEIKLKGLRGGHSGFDIAKGRENSAKEIAKIIKLIKNVQVSSFSAGTKFNVIPSNGKAKIISTESLQNVEKIIKNYVQKRKEAFPNLEVQVSSCKVKKALSLKDTEKFLNSIIDFSHGVLKVNSKDEVTTSINLGAVNLEDMIFKIGMRSSRKKEEEEAIHNIRDFAKLRGMYMNILGSQPGFETKSSSEFLKLIKSTCPKENPTVKSVHITVETGFFKEKKEDLEIAIISPKIENAHTIDECVSIKSVENCDLWIKNIIEKL